MGGTIRVESKIGVGSNFIVDVPFDNVKEALTQASNQADVDPNMFIENSHKDEVFDNVTERRILLVDDVEANRIIGAELMKNRGYVVDSAKDGFEAIERANEIEYLAILMDMRMPKLNGLEATQKIRSSAGLNATTPIIALTANAETSEIKRCIDGGMNDFVSKPFNADKLDQSIKRCIAENNQSSTDKSNAEQNDNVDQDILSERVLHQLTKDTCAESMPMMISVFMNEITKRVEGINHAEKIKDEAEIREQAHALKSCSGTFGGLKLQAVARDLEALASQSNSCKDPDIFASIRQIAEETQKRFSAYRDNLNSEMIGQEK